MINYNLCYYFTIIYDFLNECYVRILLHDEVQVTSFFMDQYIQVNRISLLGFDVVICLQRFLFNCFLRVLIPVFASILIVWYR